MSWRDSTRSLKKLTKTAACFVLVSSRTRRSWRESLPQIRFYACKIFFKRRNVVQISVDTRISQRASAIRNYYNQRGTKLTTPDSIHLATAIIYEADEFHTLDGDGKRQRANDLL